jgi:hypothetical protein
LLEHRQAETIQRYAHLADDSLKSASNLIGKHLARALGKPPRPEKGESIDAQGEGGLSRSSEEPLVMSGERRG